LRKAKKTSEREKATKKTILFAKNKELRKAKKEQERERAKKKGKNTLS